MGFSGLRRRALAKLANLSTTPAAESHAFDEILAQGPEIQLSGYGETWRVHMSFREFEVLLALCAAAPNLHSFHHANSLLHRLCRHLPESCSQKFARSSGFIQIRLSPWHSLTYELTMALLHIGLNHPSMRRAVLDCLNIYLDRATAFCQRSNETELHSADDILSLAASVLGFLQACSSARIFWGTHDTSQLLTRVKQSVEPLYNILDTTIGIIRSEGVDLLHWRIYLELYECGDWPMGPVLLRRSAAAFLLATMFSLIVPESHTGLSIYVLDFIQIRNTLDLSKKVMLNSIAETAFQDIGRIDEALARISSAAHAELRLLFDSKLDLLTVYCGCKLACNNTEESAMRTLLCQILQERPKNFDAGLLTTAMRLMSLMTTQESIDDAHFISALRIFIVESPERYSKEGIQWGISNAESIKVATLSLSQMLLRRPNRASNLTITTLNLFGHVLSSVHTECTLRGQALQPFDQQTTAGTGSLAEAEKGKEITYSQVVAAIVSIAVHSKDVEILSVAQSILKQRLGKVSRLVDARILSNLGPLILHSDAENCRALLQILDKAVAERFNSEDCSILDAVLDTLVFIACNVDAESELYVVFIVHMLASVDMIFENYESSGVLAGCEFPRNVENYVHPVALALSRHRSNASFMKKIELSPLMALFWLKCAAYGLNSDSEWALEYYFDLRILARYTPPMFSGGCTEGQQEKIPMSPAAIADLRQRLMNMISGNDANIRALPHNVVLRLHAIYLLEMFRVETGSVAKMLLYFADPIFKPPESQSCLVAISNLIVETYLSRTRGGVFHDFTSARVAMELREGFVACCHRLESVQKIAIYMVDRIVATVPSALCQRVSLFTLLELLTLLWTSCLKEETDEYNTRSSFFSELGNISIEMPDSFIFRKKTLKVLYSKATEWVGIVLDVAPLDIKTLLQTYLCESQSKTALGHVNLGRTFALEMGSSVPRCDKRLAAIDNLLESRANTASDFVQRYSMRLLNHGNKSAFCPHGEHPIAFNLDSLIAGAGFVQGQNDPEYLDKLQSIMHLLAGRVCLVQELKEEGRLVRYLVQLPCTVFTNESIKLGIMWWMAVMNERPTLQSRIMIEVARNFENTANRKLGIFSNSFQPKHPFEAKMEYAPSNKMEHMAEQQTAFNLFSPHLHLMQFLSSRFHANRLGDVNLTRVMLKSLRVALSEITRASGHSLAREPRFQLIILGVNMLRYTPGMTERQQTQLKERLLSAALSWFRFPSRWSFGSNRLQIKAEVHLLLDLANALHDTSVAVIGGHRLQLKQDLLLILIENEQMRLATWLYPLDHSRIHHLIPTYSAKPVNDSTLLTVFEVAWGEHVCIPVNMVRRFQSARLKEEVRKKILAYPEKFLEQPDALLLMLRDKLSEDLTFQLRYMLFWSPINPITAATFFLPSYSNTNQPFILQYAMRSLESHSVDVTFFYVPQIVQTLRYDALGYVKRFILETAAFSQLFAHQIIWNMKANAFKDEESKIPDPVKPTLDLVMTRLLDSFTTADKSFYEREFNFFGEVTSISGKLRPLLKKPKPEKNAKIAEELDKIKVDVGVYLPSNPDSVVIDIDRKSGRSLQSHAKAPFMASFKIRRKINTIVDQEGQHRELTGNTTKEMWQAAIFKVGDDCRQDMLALQLISAFRSIFNSVGLDVYVFPYRVTATAPGCGVIDVLPKSISRDMLGRDHDMGLYDYFINKYGDEESISFQEARNSFVKSMAAYSVISYLLKFKDRHNGNIMIDDVGHILHIDFGFFFDIAPGGITFERAPFKLTAEMVSLMGGSTDAQPYLWFEELCIKSFLTCRSYVDTLVHCVILMLDSGLSCFKPETIQNFRDRFVLDKNDREAADYMRYLINKSYSSYSTTQYDRFQHLTNGIPY